MPGEDAVGQVVESAATGPALVPLPLRLGLVTPLLDDLARIAVGAAGAVGPTQPADHRVALGVVGDAQDVDEHDGRLHAVRERSDILPGLDCKLNIRSPHSSPRNTG